MNEHRRAQRNRTLKPAKIALRHAAALDCVVRNISATGACLEVASPVGIPERFALLTEGQINRPCHVVWRTERRIGVEFD